MTKAEYCKYRNWLVPANEDPNEHGYLVEYTDGGKPNDERHSGYISWSPKEVFKRTYRLTGIDGELHKEVIRTSLPVGFGIALIALKMGKQVTRSGWNGKGMYLYRVGAGRYPPSTPAGRAIAAEQPDGLVPYPPYIAMKTVTGEVVPWLASQTDLLSDDWIILP